jgi:hypothetical protein
LDIPKAGKILNSNCQNDVEDVKYVKSDIDEYDVYSNIETHMNISLSLYQVNKEGQNILHEIGAKKLRLTSTAIMASKIKKPTFATDAHKNILTLFIGLSDIINFYRATTDVYTELLSLLDDAMFAESHDLETFYVDETEYSLESLYYKQDTWVNELEWYKKNNYNFSKHHSLDLGECSHILLFLNSYLDVLAKIKEHLSYYDTVLLQVKKMEVKILSMRDAMYTLVENHFEESQ